MRAETLDTPRVQQKNWPAALSMAASVAWALAGVAVFTATVFYMGWRSGVTEGAPLGGPLVECNGAKGG